MHASKLAAADAPNYDSPDTSEINNLAVYWPYIQRMRVCFAGWAAAQADSSQLHVALTDALFPGSALVQPTPLPLGPAYNTSSFEAFMNVTLQYYADAPAAGFAVTQASLGTLVNLLGQLYYPEGILFEVQ